MEMNSKNLENGGSFMRYVIDRIEEDVVVCENEETGEMEELDMFFMPDGIEEGDIVIYDEELDEYYIDADEKKLRIARIEDKMEDIWEEVDMLEHDDE